MPLKVSDRVARKADWPFQRIGEEIVVIVPRKRLMHRIEGVGVCIWERIERPVRVDDLVGDLLEEFEIDAETLRRDVLDFLERLRELDLLEVE